MGLGLGLRDTSIPFCSWELEAFTDTARVQNRLFDCHLAGTNENENREKEDFVHGITDWDQAYR